MLQVKDSKYTFTTRCMEKPWVFTTPMDYLTMLSANNNLVYLGAFHNSAKPVNADAEQLEYIQEYIDQLKAKESMPIDTDREILIAASRNVTVSGAPRSPTELHGRHCIALLPTTTAVHVYALRSQFEQMVDNVEAFHAYRIHTDAIICDLTTRPRSEVLGIHMEKLSTALYGGQALPLGKHNIDIITTGTKPAQAYAYAVLHQLGVEA